MAGSTETVGRGALYVPLAKVWFVFASFLLNFGLPNLLTAREVGDYGVVNRLISLLTMVMITGSVQTVAKYVSEDPDNAAGVLRTTLRLQLLFAGSTSLLCFAAAPFVARSFRDLDLVTPLRIAALIPLAYGFYALFIGVLNGSRRFRSQALFDIAYATLRTAAILAAAALGYGVSGVFAAFAMAAVTIAILAAWHGRANLWAPGRALPVARVLRFAAPILSFVLVSQWLLSFDLFWVKRLVEPALSKEWSGAYFSLLNVALVPFMLTVSVSSIVFPLISRATFLHDPEKTTAYISRSLRVALLVAVAMEAVVAASPVAVIQLLYPTKPEYVLHAWTLRTLAVAYAFLCVNSVMMTILNGSDRPRVSLTLASACLAAQGFAAAILLPRFGLLGASIASLGAFAATTLVASTYLRRTLGAGLAAATLLRTAIAALPAVLVGHLLELTGPGFIVECVVVTTVFAVALVITGEIRRADWRLLVELVGRR